MQRAGFKSGMTLQQFHSPNSMTERMLQQNKFNNRRAEQGQHQPNFDRNVKSRPCFNRVLQLSTNCLVFYFFLSLLIAAYCLLSKRNKPHMNSVKLPAFIKKKTTTCTFTELTSYHDYTNAERREIGFQETFTFGHCAYSQMQC